MKLYMEQDPAPNPRRVRIFLAEKALALGGDGGIEEVRIDLVKREHKSPEHRARNSLGQVPVLELDDGRLLSESVAICRYLEALHPDPPLFGRAPFEAAVVDMWVRRVEMVVMVPVGMFWRHAHERTARLLTQHRDFGESNRANAASAMRWLDRELAAGGPFIAGDAFSMADIVAVTTLDFARLIGLPAPDDCAALAAWRGRMARRPSMAMPEGVERRYQRAGEATEA